MKLNELMRFMGLFLEEEAVDYYVLGATAMNFWIPPRNTVDLDIVLCIEKRRAVSLIRKLKQHKFPITKSLARKFFEGRFIKIGKGDTELDLKLCETQHERESLARSKIFDANDHRLRIAVPEDIVLSKLQFWRKQDQADIERMLKLRKDLDTKYVEKWLNPIEQETGFPMRERWKEALSW